jgi:hypothetical protein
MTVWPRPAISVPIAMPTLPVPIIATVSAKAGFAVVKAKIKSSRRMWKVPLGIV